MMHVGIFARTYDCPTLDETLDAIVGDGIQAVHFNLRCAGIDALPDVIEVTLRQTIRGAFESRHLEMVGLSGTFNAIHPDAGKRAVDIEHCKKLIEYATSLGTNLVSLCTGTRDPEIMWRAHRDNDTPEAWRDLLDTLQQLLPVAERNRVTLGIEPERANVIDTAAKARRLLDELQSPCLKVIMDGANLFDPDNLEDMWLRLAGAFDLLSPDIAQVHAKDIPATAVPTSQAAGTGCLDWETYFDLIARAGFRGPIVLHNLDPMQVASSRDFVLRQIDRITSQAR